MILVGEMRDLETIGTALTAAETGHLVFGTLHTQSAAGTIDRIIDVFPAEQQEQVRMQISGTLQGVVTQALMQTADGQGRVPALEILLPDDAVRNLIRQAKVEQIYSIMQTSSARGMITMEQALADLVVRGVVTYEVAVSRSSKPDQLRGQLERMELRDRGAGARDAGRAGAFRRRPEAGWGLDVDEHEQDTPVGGEPEEGDTAATPAPEYGWGGATVERRRRDAARVDRLRCRAGRGHLGGCAAGAPSDGAAPVVGARSLGACGAGRSGRLARAARDCSRAASQRGGTRRAAGARCGERACRSSACRGAGADRGRPRRGAAPRPRRSRRPRPRAPRS